MKNTSVSASKLLTTLTTMKFTVFVIFAILVENSVSIPLLKRSQRSPQFVQNYAPGSQSQNFNCQYGGCGNIGGMQQIHGSHVSNHGSQFRYVGLLKSSGFAHCLGMNYYVNFFGGIDSNGFHIR